MWTLVLQTHVVNTSNGDGLRILRVLKAFPIWFTIFSNSYLSRGKRIRRPSWKILTLKEEKNAYNIGDSQAVSDPSTNPTQRCLTCQIGRDGVFSTWYGRKRTIFRKTPVCRARVFGSTESASQIVFNHKFVFSLKALKCIGLLWWQTFISTKF